MKVAVAVIVNDAGKLLITQRAKHSSHAGLWEFPGGKIEDNESPYDALFREIHEEVGLTILESTFLTQVDYTYDAKTVRLMVYGVSKFQGLARCCEGQLDLQWVSFNGLKNYQFPDANHVFLPLVDQWLTESAFLSENFTD